MERSFCPGREVDPWHLCSVEQGIRRCIVENIGVMYIPLDGESENRRPGPFVCCRRGKCTGHNSIRGRRFWAEEHLSGSVFALGESWEGMLAVCRFWMADEPFVWDLRLEEYWEDVCQSGLCDGAELFEQQP